LATGALGFETGSDLGFGAGALGAGFGTLVGFGTGVAAAWGGFGTLGLDAMGFVGTVAVHA